jgi:N-dimethylarginine dimethylaminohydrolase
MPRHIDEIIGIELASWRLNLDGVLVPVAPRAFVTHRGSICRAVRITGSGRDSVDVVEMLRETGMAVIEPTAEESKREACNNLCVGEGRVVSYDLTPRVHAQFEAAGIEVARVPGHELIKGTGGPRCMSRPVYRPVRAQEASGDAAGRRPV